MKAGSQHTLPFSLSSLSDGQAGERGRERDDARAEDWPTFLDGRDFSVLRKVSARHSNLVDSMAREMSDEQLDQLACQAMRGSGIAPADGLTDAEYLAWMDEQQRLWIGEEYEDLASQAC